VAFESFAALCAEDLDIAKDLYRATIAWPLGTVSITPITVVPGEDNQMSYSDVGLCSRGRYIVYARRYVGSNGLPRSQVIRRDTATDSTLEVSAAMGTLAGDTIGSRHPAISGDGRYVTYSSSRPSATPAPPVVIPWDLSFINPVGDDDCSEDVYLYDCTRRRNVRVSLADPRVLRAWPTTIARDASMIGYSAQLGPGAPPEYHVFRALVVPSSSG
jgi:hypothetical protein